MGISEEDFERIAQLVQAAVGQSEERTAKLLADSEERMRGYIHESEARTLKRIDGVRDELAIVRDQLIVVRGEVADVRVKLNEFRHETSRRFDGLEILVSKHDLEITDLSQN